MKSAKQPLFFDQSPALEFTAGLSHALGMNEEHSTRHGFSLLDTTADTGFTVWGSDPKALFYNAWMALDTLLYADRDRYGSAGCKPERVQMTAPTMESLLVDFLNFLLLRIYSRTLTIERIDIDALSPTSIEFELYCRPWIQAPQLEIKAATHHQLRIRRLDGRLQARVVLDI